MRKLFLHLFISCTMFYFGVTLSHVTKFLSTGADSSPIVVNQEPRLKSVPMFHTVDEVALHEIFTDYGPAQTNHDRAFFERVEADDFILFQPSRKLTREQDIREMESWPLGINYAWDIESIQVFGDSAVVIGRMRRNGVPDSQRSIHVCVKNGTAWQILSTTSEY